MLLYFFVHSSKIVSIFALRKWWVLRHMPLREDSKGLPVIFIDSNQFFRLIQPRRQEHASGHRIKKAKFALTVSILTTVSAKFFVRFQKRGRVNKKERQALFPRKLENSSGASATWDLAVAVAGQGILSIRRIGRDDGLVVAHELYCPPATEFQSSGR